VFLAGRSAVILGLRVVFSWGMGGRNLTVCGVQPQPPPSLVGKADSAQSGACVG